MRKVIQALRNVEVFMYADVECYSLRKMIAACVYALGVETTSLLEDVSDRLAKIAASTVRDLARLREVRSVAEKVAVSEMYPEELVEVLKLRLKKELYIKDESHINWGHLGMGDVLARVQYLVKSAEIAVERGRSDALETHSRFVMAALSIVREGGSDS